MRSGTISVLDAGSIAWTSEAMQNCTGIVARLIFTASLLHFSLEMQSLLVSEAICRTGGGSYAYYTGQFG